MSERNDQKSPQTGPPPIRRNTGRTVIVLTCATIIALLLLVVVFNIDTGRAELATDAGDDDVIELFDPPSTLTEQEERELTDPDAEMSTTLPLEVPRGGWLQMQDDRGRLAQRLRFTRSEPRPAGKPDGWSRLEQPEAELFVSDDQAIVLRGDEALAYIPNQGLEEGSVAGNVVIELYNVDDSRVIDRQHDTPTFVVRTEQATFDNMIGEVRCPGEVELIAPGKAEILGTNLTLRINDVIDRLELLEIAHVEYIKLTTPDDEHPSPASARQNPRPRNQSHIRLATLQEAGDETGRAAPADDAQFYELTLASNVTITQGPIEAPRVARGETLSIVFSSQSRGFNDATAGRRHTPTLVRVPSLSTALASMVIASVDQPRSADIPEPGVDETIITFDGPLRVLPMDQPQLESPEDSRFVLTGSPVELTDATEQARATAGRLVYASAQREVELVRADGHAVHIESPKLTAGGDRFWLAQETGEGGFTGEGWLRPAPDDDDTVAVAEGRERSDSLASMRITWTQGVELRFTPVVQDDELGPLERVRLTGNVRVRSDDGTITAKSLDLTMRPDPDDEPVPDVLIATGNVSARNPDQTIWADALEVKFMHPDDAPVARAPGDDETRMTDADVRHITAHGDVQILMADGSRVFADRLEGDGVSETLDLFGRNIVIAAGRMLIERGTEVRVRQGERIAHWNGLGTARVFDSALETSGDRRLPRPSIAGPGGAEPAHTMTVNWTDGVTLSFVGRENDRNAQPNAPGSVDATFGRLDQVVFNGNVQIDSVDGAIECDTLDLEMIADADGRPQPEVMTATGSVMARNDEQTIWADVLNVQFITQTDAGRERGTAPAEGDDEAAAATVVLRDDLRVRHVAANGNVQILLADGSRAFADRLDGDGINETLDLHGENIVIASGRMLAEHGTLLTLRKGEQTAHWDGPGTVRLFGTGIDTSADQRIARPVVEERVNPVTVRVTWDESMLYDHGFNAGAGAVDLRGNVDAYSSQNSLEENRMTGDALTLEFVDSGSSSTQPDSDASIGMNNLGDRKLKRFVARGDAKLESRSWRSASRTEKPRVFYIAGQHIEYDDETFEARVLSDGTLLLRDEWPADAPDDEEAPTPGPAAMRNAAPGSTFSGKGTTLFTWTRRLHMHRMLDDRYSIDMAGEVTVIHESLDGRTATVTAEELSAVVTRLDQQRRRGAGLDMGGAMDLRRLNGAGGVLIETPTRTVESASLEYNVDTAMAQLRGGRGRPVTIINEGAAYPLHAQEVLWNMKRDTITIVRGAGSGGR